MKPTTDNAPVNRAIKAIKMRVIAPNGDQLGVISRSEALRIAEENELDLVCVSPNTDPVVCKIMDYGKHLYKLKKKAKDSKKKQAVIEVKELKIRPNTDDHDLQTKIKQAVKFLEAGNNVKFTVFFRGREVMFVSKALENLDKVIEELGGRENLNVDLDRSVKNKKLSMMLTPKN